MFRIIFNLLKRNKRRLNILFTKTNNKNNKKKRQCIYLNLIYYNIFVVRMGSNIITKKKWWENSNFVSSKL